MALRMAVATPSYSKRCPFTLAGAQAPVSGGMVAGVGIFPTVPVNWTVGISPQVEGLQGRGVSPLPCPHPPDAISTGNPYMGCEGQNASYSKRCLVLE